MAQGRITKRSVDALKPGKRDSYLWDSELPGFGLKVTPAGGRTYLVQYRIGGRKGRTRRVTIGKHGTVTPDKAREKAKRLLGQVADGQDPAERKTQARSEPSMAEIADRYLEEHVAVHNKPSQEARCPKDSCRAFPISSPCGSSPCRPRSPHSLSTAARSTARATSA